MDSLGFDKPAAETRIVVAMSGGVDSSVTAALLAEAGYDVVGVTLQLYDHGEALARKGACCAGQDIQDARNVAAQLDIPHYVLDYESAFQESVIDDFADSYVRGETPIPCVRCNQTVKFRDLLSTAKDLGAEALATGHYVRRAMGHSGAELHRAIDDTRDQSYFLFATTGAQLDFLRFPLGGMDKPETRRHAARFDLPVADKPDSQDICFVPNGSYARIVEKLRPEALTPGDIVDRDGNILGQHDGIINYTVGQRRGLGIGGRRGDDDVLYVLRLDPTAHRVVVGPHAALAVDRVRVGEVNWLGDGPLSGRECMVKLRSIMAPVAARLTANVSGTDAMVELAAPEFGVSPGQACVFYDGDRVLGGGWIKAQPDVLVA